MFKGSIVAIVTPFRNDKVDEKKLRELIDFLHSLYHATDAVRCLRSNSIARVLCLLAS